MQFNIRETLLFNILCLYVIVFQVQALQRSDQTYWSDHEGEVPRSLANLGGSPHSPTRLMVYRIQGAYFMLLNLLLCTVCCVNVGCIWQTLYYICFQFTCLHSQSRFHILQIARNSKG